MMRFKARRLVASAVVVVTTCTPFFAMLNPTVASAQTVQNTSFGYLYDAMGNLTQVTDPLGRVSNQSVDALARVKQQLQPPAVTGSIRPTINYTYDLRDHLATVSDPRSLITTYAANGLDDETSLASPDTGATGRTFDASGRVATITDARGKVTAYQYDILGRVTREDYTTGTPTVFEYDGGSAGAPNAIGHLTRMTDESGQTIYSYDQAGRVLAKAQTTTFATSSSLARTVSYAYDGSGRPVSLTYPSGARITFSYDSAGRISRVALNPADQLGNTDLAAETVLLDQIGYSAFGAIQSWVWGNSTPTAINVYTRTFDLDGRITTYPLGNVAVGSQSLLRTLTYDAASNITAFTHTGNATASSYDQTFSYDGLNRLTTYSAGNSTQSYAYDANGNRTQIAFGGTAYANTVSTTSNRLNSTAGPSPAKTNIYDANGVLKSDGTVTYSYSDRGRMSSSQTGAVSASYLYNGFGQRVSKVTPLVATGRTVYAYDEEGRVIGEYYGDGQVQQETVYLGNLPVAVLRPGTGTTDALAQVFYVYLDHINTPRVITSAATGNIVWRWDSTDPFGLAQANENPGAEGAFVYDLRFPGQIFDRETNNHYNYYRDYDPQTGRYIQSDPIGLEGGINTYAYVGGNPLRFIDPFGLAPAPQEGITPICIECAFIPIVRAAGAISSLLRRASADEPQACHISENRAPKIFGKREGHILDTPANRQLLEKVANDESATLGADKFGNQWSAKMQSDGTQIWTQTRNGEVINGGVNASPQTYNPATGLSSPVKPGGK